MIGFSTDAVVVLVLLGFGVGTFGTLVGAGGGFILTPVLLLLYPHDSARTITSISIFVVFLNAVSGSLAYLRQRRADYRSGLVFAIATLPGAIGGALVVGSVPRHVFDALTAGLLGALALWLLRGRRRPAARQARSGVRRRVLVDAQGETHAYDVRLWLGAAYSLAVGFVSSFLGIGGGVIHVPLLVQALGFPVHVATATSHFVLAIMSGASVATHAVHGSYAVGEGLRRSLALGAGVVAGAQVGARLSLRVSGPAIQRLLSVALLVLAVRLAVAV